jgi:hypothetical protein
MKPRGTAGGFDALKPCPASLFQIMNSKQFQLSETAPAGPWRGVFFDGPQPDQNADGDEIPVWLVYEGDEEAEPIGDVHTCHDFTAAERLAQRIARDRRLELIHEATTA